MGVHLGNGNLGEENWRPRINAVEKCLNCWCGRSLSSSGKALIVNALALSRVWYVASLLPMPDWVVSELNTLVFSFFWSGKRDLVARDVVYHSTFQGGFGVVFVRYTVHALLAQWVRRYVTALNAWAHMMTFWLFDCIGVDPQTVLATPSLFLLVASGLPAFYCTLLRAWTALHVSLSQAGLIIGSAASMKGRLSFYLPPLFKRFRSRRRRRFFQCQWGANGCISKVVADPFHFCLS